MATSILFIFNCQSTSLFVQVTPHREVNDVEIFVSQEHDDLTK